MACVRKVVSDRAQRLRTSELEAKYAGMTNYQIVSVCHRKSEDLLCATANLIVLLNSNVTSAEGPMADSLVEEVTTKPMVKVHAAGAHAMLTAIVNDIRELMARLEEAEAIEGEAEV